MSSGTFSGRTGLRARRGAGRRRGLTLIEMMVALAATLIMIGAVTQVFALLSADATKGRALLETVDRIRSARQKLQNDLIGSTAPKVPRLATAEGAGYFQVYEGPNRDFNDSGYQVWPQRQDVDGSPVQDENGNNLLDTRFGDMDDVLVMTVRNRVRPFVERRGGRNIESDLAEVIWFVYRPPQNDPALPPPLGRLYRIVRVLPEVENDTDPTLGSLTLRQNRWAGMNLYLAARPYPLSRTALDQLAASPNFADSVVLTGVLAFDVRVWDPHAPLQLGSGTNVMLTPGDPGYDPSRVPSSDTTLATAPQGAFVDLGYLSQTRSGISYPGNAYGPASPNASPRPHFGNNGLVNLVTGATDYRTWDTWPADYEYNGQDDDGDGVVDEGTNGLDDDNQFGVDDGGELETHPPYPYPLRGIQVTIRVYEPSSRQIRQVSVVQEFVPE